MDLDFPRRRNRKRKRQRQRARKPQRQRVRVRVPVTATEPETSRVPSLKPVFDPRTQLNPQDDKGKNPYRDPTGSPVPLPMPAPSPLPNPRRDPGATPGVNQKQPMPKSPMMPAPNVGLTFDLPYDIPSPIPPQGYVFKGYSEEQNQWGNDLITNINLVSRLTAIEGKQIYTFLRDYDYETHNLSTFTTDAQKEFGTAAGVLLATGVGVKMLGQMWGKRISNVAGSTFGGVKLDDEFLQDYFGTKTY